MLFKLFNLIIIFFLLGLSSDQAIMSLTGSNYLNIRTLLINKLSNDLTVFLYS